MGRPFIISTFLEFIRKKSEYPRETSLAVALWFRLGLCFGLIFALWAYAFGYDLFVESLLAGGRDHLPGFLQSVESFQALRILLTVSLAICAFGVGGSWSALTSLILFCVYEGIVSPQLKPYSTNFAFFALVGLWLLGPLPAFNRKNLRAQIRWPTTGLFFIQLMIALLYFSAFICKIASDPKGWFSGYALRADLVENTLFTDSHWAHILADRPTWLAVLAVATLIIEGFFWLSLFRRRWALVFLASALSLHMGIWLVMQINFLHFLLPCYLCFLPWFLPDAGSKPAEGR